MGKHLDNRMRACEDNIKKTLHRLTEEYAKYNYTCLNPMYSVRTLENLIQKTDHLLKKLKLFHEYQRSYAFEDIEEFVARDMEDSSARD